jgi:uncharacterized protein
MPLFALTLSHEMRAELEGFVEFCFILFVLVSFVCVAAYTVKQIRTGKLFTGENVPFPIVMQSASGWVFVACVVGLIYLQSPLYAIVVLVGITVVLAENRRTIRTQFGLDRVKPSKAVAWGLLVFGAIMLVEEPLTQAWEWILDLCNVSHPEQPLIETVRQYNHASAVLWFMLQGVFLFPVIEELFFRGFLLTFLKNYTSTWLAIVLSAGVFAIAHLNLGAVLPLWFLGVVLGVAYEHTGCLIVPISIHACFNLTTTLSLLMDKGNSS